MKLYQSIGPNPRVVNMFIAEKGVHIVREEIDITGWRHHSDGSSVHKPMPRPSAHIHELICAGVAPSAVAAWNTIATELVKPTSTATKPAVAAESEKSRKTDRIWPPRR